MQTKQSKIVCKHEEKSAAEIQPNSPEHHHFSDVASSLPQHLEIIRHRLNPTELLFHVY